MDGSASSASSSGFDMHDRLIVAHAVFASLVTLFTVPFAILSVRFLRPTAKRWFPTHLTLQSLTLIFLIIVFSLGTSAVVLSGHGSQFTGPKADRHHRLGLAIFIIVLVQALLGAGSHFTRARPNVADAQAGKAGTGLAQMHLSARRYPLRFAHVFLGLSLAALLYTQMYLGFIEWDMASDNGSQTPRGVVIVFWIVFALEIAAYVGGFVIEHVLRRRAVGDTSSSGEGDKLNMEHRASQQG